MNRSKYHHPPRRYQLMPIFKFFILIISALVKQKQYRGKNRKGEKVWRKEGKPGEWRLLSLKWLRISNLF